MSGFPQNQYFYIKSRNSDSVMDVYMGETTVDSNVIIWPKKDTDDNDNQLWRSEDGFLINKKSNLGKAHNQRFGYRDGFIYCLADPRLVLDIKGGGSKEGTKVILYKRKETDFENQQWDLIPIGVQQGSHVPYYPPPTGMGGYGYGAPDN
ncbi:hypothetical protein INT48_003016 [Thamnidium elegans]|uniref:Ricin B lectin domain-containing protein n=1 Tax=Thamnidium elegans TaxID=101142 RepID=A0A8H7VVS0_9FUNG|nr:hypothetical protein INT48_003016 [Thamnidium elegans]